jgi:DNA-directed RNA polymerase subunit alpha
MIPLPHPPKIIEKKGNKVVLEIEPLYPGYGVTLGNSLRRVLLSSLEGAAITEVKIKGVDHEFSTIQGVLEDVVMILLSLKKIRFKSWSEEPQLIKLSVKGEKEVKAKDFQPNPNLEIVNPNLHIATLTNSKAELEIEAKIEKGVGYSSVEDREERKTEVGVIPIDAIFTPITKVSFRTENIRFEKRTDFDKLILEIYTDGTIAPEEAFVKAVDILMRHLSLLVEFMGKEEPKKEKEKAEKKAEKKKEKELANEDKAEELKKTKIEDLKISERTKNALLKGGVKSLGGLTRKSEKDLLALEGLGEKGVKEIKKALKKYKLELK